MTIVSKLLRIGALPAAFAAFAAPVAQAQYTFGAPQAVELWGGPAAKGNGASGSRFDTTVTVSSVLAPASGTVDFWAGGTLRASVPFALEPRGVASIPAPPELDGAGAFLYHVTSSAAVLAFSETFNDTPNGRFGVSVPAFTTADFLTAGDEGSGGGAEDSTDSTRSRTNVGILCSSSSSLSCQLEVTAYRSSSLLGIGTLTAGPGSVAQASLAAVVPGASGQSDVSLRMRVLSGQGQPYAIRNDNRTSDGTLVPLAVARGAFSTAPTITSFTVTPTSGCSPLTVTLSWATNAAKVNISGVTGDLAPNGSTSVTLLTTTDLVLTATAASGATSSVPRHVNVAPPSSAPTPSPADAQVPLQGTVTGIIPPAPTGTVTAAFIQHESSGSTFTLQGGSWVYVAGSTPGTDIIRLTAENGCAAATADFTATVLPPGAPQIVSFTADPPLGCTPQNTVFSWQTVDATMVLISSVPGQFAPNGSWGITITNSSGTRQTYPYTLTARAANGQKSTKTIGVTIDVAPPAPVLNPSSYILTTGNGVDVLASNYSTLQALRIVPVQNQSHGTFVYTTGGIFRYTAGPVPNSVDIWRVYETNGCGSNYATFQAQVN